MDPDENVREQNRITTAMLRGEDVDPERLRELSLALREWIAHGGFHPTVKLEHPTSVRHLTRRVFPV